MRKIRPEVISLNIESSASITGVSRATLYNATNSGKLPSRVVEGRRVILRGDLLEWIRSAPPPTVKSVRKIDSEEIEALQAGRS